MILNAQGPINVLFSAIILPALVKLTLIGGERSYKRQNVIEDHSAFKPVASRLVELCPDFFLCLYPPISAGVLKCVQIQGELFYGGSVDESTEVYV